MFNWGRKKPGDLLGKKLQEEIRRLREFRLNAPDRTELNKALDLLFGEQSLYGFGLTQDRNEENSLQAKLKAIELRFKELEWRIRAVEHKQHKEKL